MDKSDNIEAYTAYNILLRICDTADLLLSIIHQYKFLN